MTSRTCFVPNVKTGIPCGHAAFYIADGKTLCRLHARLRGKNRDEFLIANQGRVLGTFEATGPQEHILSGLLANGALCRFEYRGILFRTAQAGYEAMKFFYEHEDPVISQALYKRVWEISEAVNLSDVRRLGGDRELPIRPDWNARGAASDESMYSVRDRFMYDILTMKFASGTSAAADLLATGDAELIDTSPGGEYWTNGANANGRNRLGELLMNIRLELRESRAR